MVGAQRPLPSRCLQNGDHAATYRKARLPLQPVPGRAGDIALKIDEKLCSSMARTFTLVELLECYKVEDLPAAKKTILAGFTDTASAVVLRREGEGRASACVLLCNLYPQGQVLAPKHPPKAPW